jgi:hypothetical protein
MHVRKIGCGLDSRVARALGGLTLGLAVGLALAAGAPLGAQGAGDADEPPVELSPSEQGYVDGFARELERFRGMSLEEFELEFGPQKAYLSGGPRRFVRGDANESGRVDISDAACVLVHLFVGTGPCARPSCLDPFDADDSGAVEVTDAVSLLGFLFRGGAPPPAPFPAAGEDSTDDDLACAPAASALAYEPLAAEHLGEVFAYFLPSVAQEDAYRENGFVIYENVGFESMLRGYFELWRRHLPVYISVDSILDALHLSFDRMLMALEERALSVELQQMLDAMEGGIDGLRELAAGRDIEAELDDAAAWVCAARSLLAGEKAPCARGVGAVVEAILGAVAGEGQTSLVLFGAWRAIDFSHFKVRGHYTRTEALSRYFRAMMWVQRVGLEFTHRLKGPRDARLAYLLTALLERTGAIERWRSIDDAVRALVDVSDSLNPPGMQDLAAAGGFALGDLYPETRFGEFRSAALASGAGRQRINSELITSDPFAVPFTPLPPLFHVMGQRFVVDSYAFQNVTFDRIGVPGGWSAQRWMPSPLDAWFVLGNRATVPLLRAELAQWPYHPHLAALELLVSGYEYEGFWDSSLYNVWLAALRTLDEDTTSERYPEVLRTEAWDRRMLHAQLGSWAQLRHDFVLYAKPSFPPGGCFYPEGWVDPYPDFYETIGRFAVKAKAIFGGIDGGVEAYFDDLALVSGELAGIARTELAEEPLSEEQTRFIRGWLTHRTLGCGVSPEMEIDRTEPMVFDGWYPRIIYLDGANDVGFNEGEGPDPTIADIHTTPPPPVHRSEVLHVAVSEPRLMLISIENSCGTRAYVGPVLSYHELVAGELHRWTDEEWKEALASGVRPSRPWWTREFIR